MGRLNDFWEKRLISEMVMIAIKGKMKATKHYRQHRLHKFHEMGYLQVKSEGKTFITYELTQKGKDVVMGLPEGYCQDWFPLVSDVETAKRNLIGAGT